MFSLSLRTSRRCRGQKFVVLVMSLLILLSLLSSNVRCHDNDNDDDDDGHNNSSSSARPSSYNSFELVALDSDDRSNLSNHSNNMRIEDYINNNNDNNNNDSPSSTIWLLLRELANRLFPSQHHNTNQPAGQSANNNSRMAAPTGRWVLLSFKKRVFDGWTDYKVRVLRHHFVYHRKPTIRNHGRNITNHWGGIESGRNSILVSYKLSNTTQRAASSSSGHHLRHHHHQNVDLLFELDFTLEEYRDTVLLVGAENENETNTINTSERHRIHGAVVSHHDEALLELVVPADVTHIRVRNRRNWSSINNKNKSNSKPHHFHRWRTLHFHPLGDDDGDYDDNDNDRDSHDKLSGARFLSERALVRGRTDRHTNIVFVSSGYKSEATFVADVERIHTFWHNNTVGKASPFSISAQPFHRYATTLNLFAVYEKSHDEGVSIRDDDGEVAVKRKNNINCHRGQGTDRSIACDRGRVRALASLAPAADVIVVIVNDPLAGGSGGGGVAVVSAGPLMEFYLMHTIGHAFAALGDEYDFGYDEAKHITNLKNCHYSDSVDVPWQPWIDRRVLGKPKPVCGYTNYYKSEGNCVMDSVGSHGYCTVCNEQVALALYRKPMDLLAPRCPLPGEVVFVEIGSTFPVYVDERVTYPPGGAFANSGTFDAWIFVGGVQQRITHTPIFIRTAELGVGVHKITFFVRDNTTMITPCACHGLEQWSNFTLVVTPTHRYVNNANCTYRRHPTSAPALCRAGYYCSYCTNENDCGLESLESAVASRLATVPMEEDSDPVMSTTAMHRILYYCIGSAATTVVLLLVVLNWFGRRRIRPLYALTLRGVFFKSCLLVVLMVCMVGCIFKAALCIEVVGTLRIYGLTLMTTLCTLALLQFAVSFVAFAAVYLHSVLWMVSTTVMTIGGILTGIGGTAYVFYAVRTDPDVVRSTLESAWAHYTSTLPEVVCALQGEFQCSGFNHSCLTTPNSTFCPVGCHANEYIVPCVFEIERAITTYYLRIGAGMTVILTLQSTALALLIALLYTVHQRLKQRRLQRHQQALRLLPHALSPEEVCCVRRRFSELDGDADGYVSTDALADVLLHRDGLSMHRGELLAALRSFAGSDERRMTLREFTHMFGALLASGTTPGPRRDSNVLVISPEEVATLRVAFEQMGTPRINAAQLRDLYDTTMTERLDADLANEIFRMLVQMRGTVGKAVEDVRSRRCRRTGLTFSEYLQIYNPHFQIMFFEQTAEH
eukprot:PhM_4_TR5780/c0_g1_i1/m.57042